MRKLALLLFLVVVVTSCSPPEKTIDVSFFGTRSDKYHIIYDLSEEGFLFSGKEKTFNLEEPSKETNPGTAIQSGNFYVTTDAPDKLATFAKTVYHTIDLPDGGVTLNAFTHVGDNPVYLGSDFDSRVWMVKGDDDPVLVANIEYREVTFPDGEKSSILMRKGKITNDKWVGDAGGKIYQEDEEGVVKQIGFVEWRLIKMANGNAMTIMMAKSMSEGAKWRGFHNGIYYIDK